MTDATDVRTNPLRPSRRTLRLYAAIFAALIVLVFFSQFPPSLRNMIAMIGASLVLGAMYWHFRVTLRRRQRALNESLATTGAAPEPFFLYLRSFGASGRNLVWNRNGTWLEQSLIGSSWDVEHALTAALAPLGPLVAIGDKFKTIGAAKITVTDAEWRAAFWDLAGRARRIFLTPAPSEALLWEVEQIAGDAALRDKAFFVMPPIRLSLLGLLHELFVSRSALRWRRTRALVQPKGVALPPYSWRGGVFQLGADGRAREMLPLNMLGGAYVRAMIEAPERAKDFPHRIPIYSRWFFRLTIFAPGVLLAVLVAYNISLVTRTLLIHPYSVPSRSMTPTLWPGDYMITTKFAYGYSRFSLEVGDELPSLFDGRLLFAEPQRGDVVVFNLPAEPGLVYVKRLIGLPGDRVQIREGRLLLNGAAVRTEPVGALTQPQGQRLQGPLLRCDERLSDAQRCVNRIYLEGPPGARPYFVSDSDDNQSRFDNTPVYFVPEGHYFFLGDNRDNSMDSRAGIWGGGNLSFVPAEYLVGRVDWILFSSAGDFYEFWRWRRGRSFVKVSAMATTQNPPSMPARIAPWPVE